MDAVDVSVVIPCRNAAHHLPKLFRSLIDQDFQGKWEVIFVDNASTDESGAIAHSYANRLNLRVIKATQFNNASHARNIGVRSAAGQKLLFIDADDEVSPGYVSAMASALDDHDFVTSRVDSLSLNPGWLSAAHPPWQVTGVYVCFDFLPAAGINVGLRRNVFESVGGFPEEYSGSQDIAFSWNIQLTTGFTLHFVSDAVYRYRYRQSLRGLFRQTYNWGFSNALLYTRFRERGMPRRSMKMAVNEWADVTRKLLGVRHKSDAAPLIVRLGYCMGRIKGSIWYRVLYF